MILATFSSYFLLLLLLQKGPPGWENTIAAKDGKASKLRPKTLECNFWNPQKRMILATFFFMFPRAAAAAPAPATPSVQKAPPGAKMAPQKCLT